MRFTVDGMVAVVTKDNAYQQNPSITSYTITLFEDRVERFVYYVTLLDVTSSREAKRLIEKEVRRQREARRRREGNAIDVDDLS